MRLPSPIKIGPASATIRALGWTTVLGPVGKHLTFSLGTALVLKSYSGPFKEPEQQKALTGLLKVAAKTEQREGDGLLSGTCDC